MYRKAWILGTLMCVGAARIALSQGQETRRPPNPPPGEAGADFRGATSQDLRVFTIAAQNTQSGAGSSLSPMSFQFTLGNRTPAIRVDLDLDNVPVRDAVKRICDAGKRDCVVDADVPEEVRITLRARGVRLGTALDLVSEAAGARWVNERRDGKERIRVGRTVPDLHAMSFSGGAGAISVSGSDLLTAPVVTPIGPVRFQGSPLLYSMREERSTFNCPHCKGQTTVVRRRQQPKCTKCDRTFQTDWQFCPADGAKRPPDPGAWQFCPMCGKRVQGERAETLEVQREEGIALEGPVRPRSSETRSITVRSLSPRAASAR